MTENTDIMNQVDDFISLMKNTPEYTEYERQKEILQRDPQLKERVDVLRRDMFMLQHESENEDIYDKTEMLERQNEDLLSRPEVHDFLDAESSYCRLMQLVIDRVMDNIDF